MATTSDVTADRKVLAYAQQLYAPEDAVLSAIRERQEAEGMPAISISPAEAKIIAVLLKAVGAKRVLEVGTLGGYSGVWIARAIGDAGSLTTIEIDAHRADVAREHFSAAGVDGWVNVIVGEANAVLPTLRPPFDAIFIDADKGSLEAYLHQAMRLLRIGGLILCDNVCLDGRVVNAADRDTDVEGVRAFNRIASSDPRVFAAVIPVRDGLTFGIKVAD